MKNMSQSIVPRNGNVKALALLFAAVLWAGFVATMAWADFYDSPTNYVAGISDVFVTNYASPSLSILNGVTGSLIKKITLPTGSKPAGIAFSPNYRSAYVTDASKGRLFYLVGDHLFRAIWTPGTSNTRIAIHPSGHFAYIASNLGILVLDTNWYSLTFQTVTAKISIDFPGSIIFTPDRKRAYITIDGNYGSISQVKMIDTATHTVVKTIQLPVPSAPQGIAATPDGKRIYVANWVAQNVSVIDSDPSSPTYNTITKVISVAGNARGIALSPSGNLAYVTLESNGVDVIVTTPSSSAFHTVIAHVSGVGFAYGAGTSLDGRFIYITDAANSKLYVIDSEPLSVTFNSNITSFTVGTTPVGIAVRPH